MKKLRALHRHRRSQSAATIASFIYLAARPAAGPFSRPCGLRSPHEGAKTYLSQTKTMGIYDRDYMRSNDRKPADTPRDIARKGVVFAGCSIVGLLLIAGMIRRNAEEKAKEIRQQRAEEEQLQTLLQSAAMAIRETPLLENEMKSEPPPMLRRLLNVNTATLEELDEVPKVSRRTAESMIEKRPFKSMEDLDRAWGIGKPTIEHLRFYLTVE